LPYSCSLDRGFWFTKIFVIIIILDRWDLFLCRALPISMAARIVWKMAVVEILALGRCCNYVMSGSRQSAGNADWRLKAVMGHGLHLQAGCFILSA
jgi:hypothetical protein